MSNKKKLRTNPRQRLRMLSGDLRLATGQVLRYGGRNPGNRGIHGWQSDDGLLVTAGFFDTPKGRLLTAGIHREFGLPSGHEIDAVTRALFPDEASVDMTMNEPKGWITLWERPAPASGLVKPSISARTA